MGDGGEVGPRAPHALPPLPRLLLLQAPDHPPPPAPARAQYADDVARITASAAKEVVIEGELRKLGELWKETRFGLHKYTNVRRARVRGQRARRAGARPRGSGVWRQRRGAGAALNLTPCAARRAQNGADRGWVLKGVDDVTLLLEDLGLNLQARARPLRPAPRAAANRCRAHLTPCCC